MATIQQVERMLQEPHAYGIHTMQVKSMEYLPKKSKINQLLWMDKSGEKHYKLNACQFIHKNSYTLVDAAQMPSALHKMTDGAELYVERVDFAFDNYVYPYDTFFPLNAVLAQLFAQKYRLTNNGLTVQVPLDGKLIKDFFVKYNDHDKGTVKFEVSYYQKILQYPESGINGRLELRCLDAGGTVTEGHTAYYTAARWRVYARELRCTDTRPDGQTAGGAGRVSGRAGFQCPAATPLWLDNNRLRIISTEQLYALLYELRPGIDAHALVRRYNAARDENERLTRCNLVSFDKLTKYVTLLRKHLYLYARKYKYQSFSTAEMQQKAA